MLLQLEHLIAQSHSNRQPFMAYLLGMASCELRSIIDRTLQEALLQPKQNGKRQLCKKKNMPEQDTTAKTTIAKGGIFEAMPASSATGFY